MYIVLEIPASPYEDMIIFDIYEALLYYYPTSVSEDVLYDRSGNKHICKFYVLPDLCSEEKYNELVCIWQDIYPNSDFRVYLEDD